MEPFAVAFGGQGSAWLETLEELVSAAGIESELAALAGEVELLLEPVAKELVVVSPDRLRAAAVGTCAGRRRRGPRWTST
ncbi:putative FATTY ACID SYNTHASE FAS domain protein [Mycobacterium kansasii 662]|uniref:Putative FATTY ACID SYNTHASE FAS domain protein n=1 Tax=Mycobacterium kansasii 662 TaxID=1299326 RepID=X7XU27_MYCKA|nr:putative FATTY ACID SYNTHASE FAS domain protein [Mycobacterium kansasii 662]